MSGVEPYPTEALSPTPHRPRWFGDLGIVAVALGAVALVASTLSWCDFSLQSFRLGAPVPVVLCPGGPSAGELGEGADVRVTAVYSGSFGDFTELSNGDEVAGWASAADADAATGVTTADIFGVPIVEDPAFDGPDCTATTTTRDTTETTVVDTTAVDTTPPTTTATTAAGVSTSVARTTVPRTTVPRTTRTTATTVTTTATTQPTTTTTIDFQGPDVGPVRVTPSLLHEQLTIAGAAFCVEPSGANVTVAVSDPNGVRSVTYEARVKGVIEQGTMLGVDEVFSGTIGPFFDVFGVNDPATSAVIAVVITATDTAGNITIATGAATLQRCVPPSPPTTTVGITTTTF